MTKKDVFVLQDILLSNDQTAAAIRRELESRKILAVNLLSSPGAGKTTLLEALADRLKGRARIAVIEGDIETERDAERIRAKGVPAWQITTGGACHLEAKMIGKVLPEIPTDIDFLFIENVGNLVCPAGYDLGERLRIVLLSTPEGDDKPKKYPKAFSTANVLLLSKADLGPHLPFNIEKAKAEALALNPKLRVFVISAITGEGLDDLIDFLFLARAEIDIPCMSFRWSPRCSRRSSSRPGFTRPTGSPESKSRSERWPESCPNFSKRPSIPIRKGRSPKTPF